MVEPTRVEARPGYRLYLEYDDGEKGEVDVSSLAGRGVFSLWNDPAAFRAVRITEHRAIAWSDTVELCADALYLQLTGKPASELFAGLASHRAHA